MVGGGALGRQIPTRSRNFGDAHILTAQDLFEAGVQGVAAVASQVGTGIVPCSHKRILLAGWWAAGEGP